MIRISVAVAAAAIAFATPAAAQQAGHGAHHAPAKADSASHAHAGHGMAAGGANEHMSGWKELDAYHMVMMGAWHPAKESANLTPARAQAGALAKAADAWAASAVPAACDSAATRASVKKVQDGSRAFAQLVEGKGADAAVLAALRELHEQFEVVNRGCKVK